MRRARASGLAGSPRNARAPIAVTVLVERSVASTHRGAMAFAAAHRLGLRRAATRGGSSLPPGANQRLAGARDVGLRGAPTEGETDRAERLLGRDAHREDDRHPGRNPAREVLGRPNPLGLPSRSRDVGRERFRSVTCRRSRSSRAPNGRPDSLSGAPRRDRCGRSRERVQQRLRLPLGRLLTSRGSFPVPRALTDHAQGPAGSHNGLTARVASSGRS